MLFIGSRQALVKEETGKSRAGGPRRTSRCTRSGVNRTENPVQLSPDGAGGDLRDDRRREVTRQSVNARFGE